MLQAKIYYMRHKPLRRRGHHQYEKPPLSHADLIDRLKQRGLDIPNPERAVRHLRHIGYYRL